MNINKILNDKNISKYRLSKDSGVAYTTISDICNNKTQLEKCTVETVYHISKTLSIPMEELLEDCFVKRESFENFKSNICHELKELDDAEFLYRLLKDDDINYYYEKGWYPESLYLLAMLDYLSRINSIPICDKYDELRKNKLKETIYPTSILMMAEVSKDDKYLKQAVENAIPEFMRFNIVEGNIRDVA